MQILHIIHDFGPRHVAGAELYVERLAGEQQRRAGVEAEVLCGAYDPAAPHGGLRRRRHGGLRVTELINNRAFAPGEAWYASPRLNARLEEALDGIGPDLLHVHCLLGLSLDLPRLANARGIPCVGTLHDHSLLCPAGGQLTPHGEEEGARCQAVAPGRCARCFGRSPRGRLLALGRASGGGLRGAARVAGLLRRLTPGGFGAVERAVAGLGVPGPDAAAMERRRALALEAAALLDPLVSPSRSLAARMEGLGLSPGRVEVSDYGFPPLELPPRAERIAGTVRAGFVGSLVPHKGAHLLLEAGRTLQGSGLEVSIHGDPGVDAGYSARLGEAARGLGVRLAGPFAPPEAGAIYAALDCLVVPSTWPENSPLVIHEARQAGLPVVAAAIGGCQELVRHGQDGLLFEPGSAAALAAQLQRLLQEPGLLQALSGQAPEVKSIARDADQWMGRYQAALDRAAAPAAGPPPDISLLLLTRDGADSLPAVIAALDRQRTGLTVERVAVDSGSTDGTPALLEAAGFAVHRIAPGEFQHGRTRNLGLSLCRGERVVLLVQDAVPRGEGWLDALVAPLEDDAGLAGSFARQAPRPDADPVTRMYAARHPAAGRRARAAYLAPGQGLDSLAPHERLELCTFDNVCSCVRRSAWQRTPFPEVAFAEDLAWAREVLLGGGGLAYAPAAVVEHGHQRPAGYELRRAYLAHRALRRLFGLRTVPSGLHLVSALAGTLGSHLAAVARGAGPRRRHLPRALALGVALPLGQYLGGLAADTGLDLLCTEGV